MAYYRTERVTPGDELGGSLVVFSTYFYSKKKSKWALYVTEDKEGKCRIFICLKPGHGVRRFAIKNQKPKVFPFVQAAIDQCFLLITKYGYLRINKNSNNNENKTRNPTMGGTQSRLFD